MILSQSQSSESIEVDNFMSAALDDAALDRDIRLKLWIFEFRVTKRRVGSARCVRAAKSGNT